MSHAADFTYVDNVLQANRLALPADKPGAINKVYDVAFGERTTLNELSSYLRESLANFDSAIAKIEAKYCPIETS